MSFNLRVASLWLLFFMLCNTGSASVNPIDAKLEHILSALYNAAGRFDTPKPKIRLTSNNKKVATYIPTKNLIEIDRGVYDICTDLDYDSTAALAYVISHELAHSYQDRIVKGKLETNFLSYGETYPSFYRVEKVADIQGIFIAYLAGYDCTYAVPKILPKIYESYGIPTGAIPGYPSLEDRIKSVEEVLDVTALMIDLFESGTYLIIDQYYQLAINNFEYILKYFQGAEIYNNLGIVYLMAAMDIYNPKTDKYLHPFQFNTETQLDKIRKSRGEPPVDEESLELRRALLNKAITNFQLARDVDPDHASALINIITTYNLMDEQDLALELVNMALDTAKRTSTLYPNLVMAAGISFAITGDFLNANQYFSDALSNGDLLMRKMARYNIDIIQFNEPEQVDSELYEFPVDFVSTTSLINLPRLSNIDPEYLDGEIYVRRIHKGDSKIISYGDIQGNIVSLVLYSSPVYSELFPYEDITSVINSDYSNLFQISGGYILKDEPHNLSLQIDREGRVEKIVKSFFHR